MERTEVNIVRWSIKAPWGETDAHTYTYVWSLGGYWFTVNHSEDAGEPPLL